MARICPDCGRQYDIALFQFDQPVECECGAVLQGPGSTQLAWGLDRGRGRQAELARMSDEIVGMILEGYPEIDVDLAIERMRTQALEWFPGRSALFARIYEARFLRIREQFPR